MTKHTVYWPEMEIGNDAGERTEDSEKTVKEWMEHPTLRKILLTIYLGSELLRVVTVGILAGVLLVGGTHFVSISSNTAILWGFITAVALVMGIDEGVNKQTGISVRYGAFLISTLAVVSLVRLYLGFRERRGSLDDPATLASSLPIESIPVLELYKRRNRLR